jgi:hypothetical protein
VIDEQAIDVARSRLTGTMVHHALTDGRLVGKP